MLLFKDFILALNNSYFVPFPKKANQIKVCLAQWNNVKNPMKAVLDLLIGNADTFSIRSILNEKKFSQEAHTHWNLEGLSYKAKKIALAALTNANKRRYTGRRGGFRNSYSSPRNSNYNNFNNRQPNSGNRNNQRGRFQQSYSRNSRG